MFWEKYVSLCAKKGLAPNVVANEIGIKSSGSVTGWKDGATPRPTTLKKIADYFGVSVEYLLGDEDQKKEPTTVSGSELTDEEVKFLEWFRSQASEKDKALVRMIVEGE